MLLSTWQKAATTWISKTYGIKVPSKTKVRDTKYRPIAWRVDVEDRRLVKVERTLAVDVTRQPDMKRMRAIRRKLQAIPQLQYMVHESTTPRDMLARVRTRITEYMNEQHRKIMDQWQAKAREWKVSAKMAYNFVRNPEPSKALVLSTSEGITTNPKKIQDALNLYWSQKSRGPHTCHLNRRLRILDNTTVIFFRGLSVV